MSSEELGKIAAGNIGVSSRDAKSFKVPIPDCDRAGRVAGGSRRTQAPASRDRRRVGHPAPRHT